MCMHSSAEAESTHPIPRQQVLLSLLYGPTSVHDYWKHQVDLPINARSGKGELEELEPVNPVLHSLGNSEATYLSLLVPLHVY